MLTPTPGRRERTESPVPPQSVLIPTVGHRDAATVGDRIPSPHRSCQDFLEPYRGGLRYRSRLATLIFCIPCGAAWREELAA